MAASGGYDVTRPAAQPCGAVVAARGSGGRGRRWRAREAGEGEGGGAVCVVRVVNWGYGLWMSKSTVCRVLDRRHTTNILFLFFLSILS